MFRLWLFGTHDSSGGGGGGLLGREGAHEKRTMQKIQRVQNLARGTAESERVAEANMFHVRPSKLVVPSGPEPASMFDPATWGMAFPDLLPWADGVPFLRREPPRQPQWSKPKKGPLPCLEHGTQVGPQCAGPCDAFDSFPIMPSRKLHKNWICGTFNHDVRANLLLGCP